MGICDEVEHIPTDRSVDAAEQNIAVDGSLISGPVVN